MRKFVCRCRTLAKMNVFIALAICLNVKPELSAAHEVLALGFAPYKGADACGEWLAARRNDDTKARILESFTLGYVYAYNTYRDSQHGFDSKMSKNELFSELDRNCKQHKSASFTGFLDEILNEKSIDISTDANIHSNTPR